MTILRGRSGPRTFLTSALWLSGALAIVAGLVRLTGVALPNVLAIIHQLPLWVWILVGVAQAAVIVLAALKWQLILTATAPSLPTIGLGEATSATTLGTLAGQVMPIQLVTPMLRAWVARRRAIPVPIALGTSALEQAFDVIVLIAAGSVSAIVVSFAAVSDAAPLPALLASLALVSVFALATRPVWRALAYVASAGARRRPRWIANAFEATSRGLIAAASLDNRTLTMVTAISALRFVLFAALNIGVLKIIVPDAALLTLVFVFPVVLLVTALPVFPSGLGLVEVTWSSALIASGLAPEASVAAALALRVIGLSGFLAVVPPLLVPLAISPERQRMATT